MAIRGELFTTQVNLDNRAYFFNVKENRNGDVFLQIVESKVKDGIDDRRAIVVFSEDMQRFLKGMEDSLSFIEKEEKTRSKARAAKRAERDAKYSKGSKDSDESAGTKKVYRRKGESRLVADRKRTGKVIHVSSKRSTTKESGEEY